VHLTLIFSSFFTPRLTSPTRPCPRTTTPPTNYNYRRAAAPGASTPTSGEPPSRPPAPPHPLLDLPLWPCSTAADLPFFRSMENSDRPSSLPARAARQRYRPCPAPGSPRHSGVQQQASERRHHAGTGVLVGNRPEFGAEGDRHVPPANRFLVYRALAKLSSILKIQVSGRWILRLHHFLQVATFTGSCFACFFDPKP
jgi:hypothetical protein